MLNRQTMTIAFFWESASNYKNLTVSAHHNLKKFRAAVWANLCLKVSPCLTTLDMPGVTVVATWAYIWYSKASPAFQLQFLADEAWFVTPEGGRHVSRAEAAQCVPCSYSKDMKLLPDHFHKACPYCNVSGPILPGFCGPERWQNLHLLTQL